MKVIIKNDARVAGPYSLYVVSGPPNGPWYTGLTFTSLYRAKKVQRFLDRELEAQE